MIEKTLVTVVLTAYNQEKYIKETLASIRDQTYPSVQLIVIDNASTDGTLRIIEEFAQSSSLSCLIRNFRNFGLCRAFNQGLALAQGKYIIDLSGDDVLLPERIERQVLVFEELDESYGVLFSNASHIDAKGNFIKYHYERDEDGHTLSNVPSGDIYKYILEKYFICTPTMMIRTSILKEMNGYDETLAFEDFDFWVRSSVKYYYYYQDEVLTLKRNAPGSLATRVYKKKSGMLESYYAVCNKAYDLNRNQEEFDLLAARIRTFIRKCLYAQEFELAVRFRKLLNYIENPGLQTDFIVFLCKIRFPVNRIYTFYLRNFHKYFTDREVLALKIVKPES